MYQYDAPAKQKLELSKNIKGFRIISSTGTTLADAVINEDGTLSITKNRTFYLKDKFVCTDSDCTNILSKKSKTNTCK